MVPLIKRQDTLRRSTGVVAWSGRSAPDSPTHPRICWAATSGGASRSTHYSIVTPQHHNKTAHTPLHATSNNNHIPMCQNQLGTACALARQLVLNHITVHPLPQIVLFFFFNNPPTTEFSPLPPHDALPI